jgi:hypothetical protein
MKNLTLAVDERSLKAARIYAAEHDTTISEMVREFLSGFAKATTELTAEERARIREGLSGLANRSPGRLGDWKWNRDDIYAERLSRYEYPGLRRHGEGLGNRKRQTRK